MCHFVDTKYYTTVFDFLCIFSAHFAIENSMIGADVRHTSTGEACFLASCWDTCPSVSQLSYTTAPYEYKSHCSEK